MFLWSSAPANRPCRMACCDPSAPTRCATSWPTSWARRRPGRRASPDNPASTCEWNRKASSLLNGVANALADASLAEWITDHLSGAFGHAGKERRRPGTAAVCADAQQVLAADDSRPRGLTHLPISGRAGAPLSRLQFAWRADSFGNEGSEWSNDLVAF